MYRIGLAIVSCLLLACGGEDRKSKEGKTTTDESTGATFGDRFKTITVPYQLSDTVLLSNRDTATLPLQYLDGLVLDSTLKQIFGKTNGIKYTPLGKAEEKTKGNYYVIKAVSGSKKAAFLLVFEKEGQHGATVPFLVPDTDETTSQSSVIDKRYVVTKTVTKRANNEVVGEGKEVLAYDAKEKKFSLIMTDLLNDNPAILVNPIDTFAKTNKFAGDYWANKKNLVAIRDGRHANQILVYIHTENSEGDCKGELKGEFIMTSTTTAVYRQGGDPCVLQLTFAGNSVSIHEQSGCGNYRGLDCPLDGSFTRKKEEKPKETTKKKQRPKQA